MPLTVEGLSFAYGDRTVLDDVSYVFAEGLVTGVVGPSGTGKSTLLALLVGAERPASGEIHHPKGLLSAGRLQRHRVAWMTQNANLMLRRSALDNVALPLLGAGMPPDEARARASEALVRMGLASMVGQRGAELSGGERQRVAMARAIAVEAPLLIADEPTSSLDRGNRRRLLAGLRTVAGTGTIVIVATHDPEVVAECDAVLDLAATEREGADR